MIEINNLGRNYGSLKAVSGTSFSIQSGEIIGLLGPNGAGKTTIMKMMCGFLEPSAGTVKIHNIDMAQQPKQAQQHIGYLPENLPVYPEMTVVAYLEYAAGLRGIEASQIGVEIKRVIEATDLRAKAFSRIADLSRGLKQRVGVAQALLGNPSVLVLDEPTNGLDPTQTQEMRKLIKALAAHATVILSTHILSEVEAVCDRVLMVRNGKLVLDSRLEDLKKSSTIALDSSMTEQQLKKVLAACSAVVKSDFSSKGNVLSARINLATPEHIQAVSAQLAKAVVEAGAELYQLRSEKLDLESLFNDGDMLNGGIAHAA